MKLFFLLSTFSILISSGLARDAGKTRLLPNSKAPIPKYSPVLLEVDKQKETLNSLEKQIKTTESTYLLPKRVYLYFLETEKRWIWVITDAQAKLPNPLEGIRSSTVYPGSYVGAKDPKQKYWLNLEHAVWEKTFQKFQEYYWVYPSETEPARVKIVSYFPPTAPKAPTSK